MISVRLLHSLVDHSRLTIGVGRCENGQCAGYLGARCSETLSCLGASTSSRPINALLTWLAQASSPAEQTDYVEELEREYHFLLLEVMADDSLQNLS